MFFWMASKEPGITERKERGHSVDALPGNDVINQVDLEKACSLPHGRSHPPVGLRWGTISAWVVVHQDDSVSCPDDCGPEDFAGVRNCLVYRPHRYNVVALGPQPGIQQDGNKVLFLRLKGRICCHDIPPKYKGILRRVEGSPCRAILGKAGLSDSSQDHFQGVRRRRIVVHNNFSLKRAPRRASGLQSPAGSQAETKWSGNGINGGNPGRRPFMPDSGKP